MNESVGKKIVEALKRQAEAETPMMMSTPSFQVKKVVEPEAEVVSEVQTVVEEAPASDSFVEMFEEEEPVTPVVQPKAPSMEDFDMSAFGETASSAFPSMSEPASFEMPSNIVVLKKLISQLPSGVSRHTGAQIIKQTMEALGISMKSVLQDAQQVQESLKVSARECQGTIQEYKKQILALEKQSQNYQKQYSALNDLISLFIQTTR